MSCDECRGHIKILHPDDSPKAAFRALIEELELEREEAAEILEELNTEVQFSSEEEFRYIEHMEEEPLQ